MKYDFTTRLKRENTDALALDAAGVMQGAPAKPKEGFTYLPMWVADMNFATCPKIPEEIIKRASHPAYGYFFPREELFSCIIDWQKVQNGVTDLAKEDLGYDSGVLGGIVSAMHCFAVPGEPVLLLSPTYIGFTGCLTANGYRIVLSDMKQDENGIYRMDYADMEEKIQKEHIHICVFNNPHNPTGRAFSREELERAYDIFERNQVLVLSDEIWSDLLLNGSKHIPLQSISPYARTHTIAFYAASKTFNLAGLVASYHIAYDAYLRDRLDSYESRTHLNSMNLLSMYSMIGAYSSEGKEWLSELQETLSANVNFAVDFVQEHFDGVKVTKPEATYMLFLDCSGYCSARHTNLDAVLGAGWEVGVGWQDGRPFHGPCHIRMNLALPLSDVKDAFGRLQKYVFTDGNRTSGS